MKRRKPPVGFSPEVKRLVYERAMDMDGVMRCEKCGTDYGDVQVHHRRPRKSGGDKRLETNQAANALALDGACHRWVESYRAESFDQGWLVRDSHLPTDEPVLRRGVFVLLRDNGDIIPHTQPLRSVQ